MNWFEQLYKIALPDCQDYNQAVNLHRKAIGSVPESNRPQFISADPERTIMDCHPLEEIISSIRKNLFI
jgi:hypothetical protein